MAQSIPSTDNLSKNEHLKAASNFLRGTILEGLADASTGAIADSDTQLTKFHGIYQQDDRDVRNERRRQKLEKAFIFMIRVRVPGGFCTPAQWLEMDRLCGQYANQTLRLTTRQAFQLHGVIKSNLKTTIREINEALLDTIAACGDVNRNVMCNPNPYMSELHPEALETARAISDHLTPKTRAYHEIWLNGEKTVTSQQDEEEPVYGKTYLPRKFKIVLAIPPSNDVDVFAHDLGFIAIAAKEGGVAGYNVTIGGGMGMAHNNQARFPRLAEVMGFCRKEDAVKVAEAVVTTQRDFGDRSNRAHARLKYTLQDRGLEWFRSEVEKRSGVTLREPEPFEFEDTGDRYGWVKGINGHWHYTLFIQNGRVKDEGAYKLRSGLKAVAEVHPGDFRLTANQNLIIGNVPEERKQEIEAILAAHGITSDQKRSGLRLNSMACVALPTCGLSLAESERYLPDLVTELESICEQLGLKDEPIVIRMTGCPNGCARPYIAEIALVGRSPGKYNLYFGAAFNGSRLNKLYKESLKHEQIIDEVRPVLERFARERTPGEHFGDFTIRAGYVTPVLDAATDWWSGLASRK